MRARDRRVALLLVGPWVGACSDEPKPSPIDVESPSWTFSTSDTYFSPFEAEATEPGVPCTALNDSGLATSPEALTEEAAVADVEASLVRVPGSAFDMGCTVSQEPCDADELPVREIVLTSAYQIGATEVTGAQYEALMGSVPDVTSHCTGPVHVEWVDAARLANRMSELTGRAACYWCDAFSCGLVGNPYACEGYRLPTEAEWESAARCGTDLRYAGSDDVDLVAWLDSDRHTVAGKAPNGCGLYDMSGNASEWIGDTYSTDPIGYDAEDLVDPIGVAAGALRVVRGGRTDGEHYYGGVAGPEVADRSYERENQYRDGVRLARTADPYPP